MTPANPSSRTLNLKPSQAGPWRRLTAPRLPPWRRLTFPNRKCGAFTANKKYLDSYGTTFDAPYTTPTACCKVGGGAPPRCP